MAAIVINPLCRRLEWILVVLLIVDVLGSEVVDGIRYNSMEREPQVPSIKYVDSG